MTDKTDKNQDNQKTTAGDNTQAEVITTASSTASSGPGKPEQAGAQPESKVPETSEPKQEKASSSGKVLAIVAIIIALILAVILYWHGHNQAQVQAEQLTQLQQKMQQQEQQLQSSLQAAESKQNKLLNNVASRQDSLNEQIEGVSRKVLDLDSKRPNDWMLAEAEYLVRMAGRKLWLEQDAVAAAMMLANADERLAALNDPGLTPVRRALAADIASIKSVKKVDREGLVIKLNSINDQVDKLQLDGVIMARAEEPDFTLSDSISDWKANLKKSWASFSDDFVTVRRRDGNVEALLSPQQHWYLSENLKGKLLQAQLAVYREQQEIYDSSLAQSKQWLQDYFADDSVRQFMLEQIDALSGLQIKVDYPEQFAAQDSLKQLLDDRLQRLLTGQ
ncbi:uroporphyrinogen-III C-methyltransferase [Oceanisphaera sp.]|uniref:uroporphyrinogen-III C-methyltransferase n=1 Tax=Oceanisphaera sp. TaxID=1929979 RepID=UPI003A8EA49E